MRLQRNWLFKTALTLMSIALGAFGVLGWADSARLFEAFPAKAWALMDPLWPIYAVAAIACIAAQVMAACAVVNFARLTDAPKVWRFLAFAFYGVAVFFAAYSADKGAQVVLGSAHRAAYEARKGQRTALTAEISQLQATIKAEREKMSPAGSIGPKARDSETALFEATTAAERARLPVAQSTLDHLPSLPREIKTGWVAALGVFLIFLAWAVLEPWGYALAERGRTGVALPVAQSATDATGGRVVSLHPAKASPPSLFRRAMALLGLAALATGLAQGSRQAEAQVAPRDTICDPEPSNVARLEQPATDAKSRAFAMRHKKTVDEIAAEVQVHRATVYRWFRARDKELAA